MEHLEISGPSPLDYAAIDDLISLDESRPGFIGKIMTIYYLESRTRMDALEHAAASLDIRSAADAAHALRGCSANIGAIRVAQRCADLEEAARGGDQVDLGLAVAAIRSAYHAALPWLARVSIESS